MSSGTLWILLLVAGPLLMIFMHRGHGGHGAQGGHGSQGGGHGGSTGPATAPADPRTKVGDNDAGHAGHGASQDSSEQEAGGHRHRGC
jgi:hypothetical protein